MAEIISTFGQLLCFWGRCLKEGVSFSLGTFGIVDLACGIIAALLFWFNKRQQKKWEKWEAYVRKYAALIVLVQFVLGVLFVAPFIQYKEAKNHNVGTPTPSYTANLNNLTDSALVVGSGNTVDNSKKYYGDTNKPALELYINRLKMNDAGTPTRHYPIPKTQTRELSIGIQNVGQLPAYDVVIHFAAKMDVTNVIADDWQLQPGFFTTTLEGDLQIEKGTSVWNCEKDSIGSGVIVECPKIYFSTNFSEKLEFLIDIQSKGSLHKRFYSVWEFPK